MRRLLALLLLAFAVGRPAFAGDEDFQRFLNAAVRMYENLEYERALEGAKNARKQAVTPEQQATVILLLGIIEFDSNKPDEAQADFKEGLFLDPDAKIPVKVSPRVLGEIESVRIKVKKELAPLLAKQAEEKRKKAEEEAKLKAEEDAKKAAADARLKAEADKLAAQTDAKRLELARLDAETKKAEAERARLEAERQRALQNAQANPVSERVTYSDRPLNNPPLVSHADPNAVELTAPRPAGKGAPAGAIILAVLAAGAAGGGAYLGNQVQTQVEDARAQTFQDAANAKLGEARDTANIANVLFGTAGALAVGALIAGIVHAASSDGAPPPAASPSSP